MLDNEKTIPKLFSQVEVMEILRCSLSTIKTLQNRGELSIFRRGRFPLITEASIVAYIERNMHLSKYQETFEAKSAEAIRADDEKVIALARRDALKRRLRKKMKDF